MAPSSSPHFRTPPPLQLPALRHTEAPRRLSSFPQSKKFRSIVDIPKISVRSPPMAPSSSPHFQTPPPLQLPALRHTEAPRRLSSFPQSKKFRSIVDIMKIAKYAVVDPGADYFNRVVCEQCGSGELDEEMLLCDSCDMGFHMLCNRPIVVRVPIGSGYCRTCSGDPSPLKQFTQTKILDFFGIQKCQDVFVKCISPQVFMRQGKVSNALQALWDSD